MAAACTAMEVHDRRLSISKASASKISKPSPVLKNLPCASSSSPPSSSAQASPSRPVAKVVNADPSSFRRVVQELTGTSQALPPSTNPSSNNTAAPAHGPSRLQRIAPPPLRRPAPLSLPQHHSLLEQMQHQQQAAALVLHRGQQVGPLIPLSHFSTNPNFLPISDSTPNFPHPGNPSPQSTPSLPMLSPHLLSPLPALTPGDNTWANPIEVIANSPKPVINTTSSLPPLLPLPTLAGTGSFTNGGFRNLAPTTRPVVQPLPPLLSTPPPHLLLPHTSNPNVLPPWSPTPLLFPAAPFSPGLFLPASPQHVFNSNTENLIKYDLPNSRVLQFEDPSKTHL